MSKAGERRVENAVAKATAKVITAVGDAIAGKKINGAKSKKAVKPASRTRKKVRAK